MNKLEKIKAEITRVVDDQRKQYERNHARKPAKLHKKPSKALVLASRYYVTIDSRLRPFLGRCLMVMEEDYGRLKRERS